MVLFIQRDKRIMVSLKNNMKKKPGNYNDEVKIQVRDLIYTHDRVGIHIMNTLF